MTYLHATISRCDIGDIFVDSVVRAVVEVEIVSHHLRLHEAGLRPRNHRIVDLCRILDFAQRLCAPLTPLIQPARILIFLYMHIRRKNANSIGPKNR